MLKWKKSKDVYTATDGAGVCEIKIEDGIFGGKSYVLYVNGVRRMWTSMLPGAKEFAQQICNGLNRSAK